MVSLESASRVTAFGRFTNIRGLSLWGKKGQKRQMRGSSQAGISRQQEAPKLRKPVGCAVSGPLSLSLSLSISLSLSLSLSPLSVSQQHSERSRGRCDFNASTKINRKPQMAGNKERTTATGWQQRGDVYKPAARKPTATG